MKKLGLWLLILGVMSQANNLWSLDMRGETIYSIMVDRFYDGDPVNNLGDGSMPTLTHTTPGSGTEAQWKKYWGGDLKGVLLKLDYLQSIGVTAVWLSPVMQNVNGIDAQGTTGYHGYWVRDYFRVEEHFGTWQDVYNLANALHSRGMKLIMDITPNHSNPLGEIEYGALYRDGIKLTDYPSDNWTYYHHYDDPSTWQWDDRWKDKNLPLQGLADYNNGSPAIDNYLIDAAKVWLSAGVDAFRIDAVKHIEPAFIQLFTQTLNNYAYSVLGRSQGVYFFGEWFDGGAGNPDSIAFVNNSAYNTELLDFNLRKKIENVLGGSLSMYDLDNHLKQRDLEFASPDEQVLFLDNHDLSRFLLTLDQYYGLDYTTSARRLEMGLGLIMTLRGIPCVYYGTEQYASTYIQTSTGNWGSDPYNRELMPAWATTTRAASILKILSDLRRISPALQTGSYQQKWINSSILVYERILGNESVVVALNRGAAATITVSGLGLPSGSLTDLLGTATISVNNGTASLSLPANSIQVWRGVKTLSTEQRTVVFIQKETVSGQDIFIRGGHDADLVSAGYYPAMNEPITYNNMLNATTLPYKQNDPSLDWSSDSALDWTTSAAASPWHVSQNLYYSTVGYGVDAENTWGMHWWKFDVMMAGAKGDWFEFKAFMRQNGTSTWENNISQTGTPYASINHWGRKGYITRVVFGSSWVEFIPLN